MKFGDEFLVGKDLYKVDLNGIYVKPLGMQTFGCVLTNVTRAIQCCSGMEHIQISPVFPRSKIIQEAVDLYLSHVEKTWSTTNLFVFARKTYGKGDYYGQMILNYLKKNGAKCLSGLSNTTKYETLTVIYTPHHHRIKKEAA